MRRKHLTPSQMKVWCGSVEKDPLRFALQAQILQDPDLYIQSGWEKLKAVVDAQERDVKAGRLATPAGYVSPEAKKQRDRDNALIERGRQLERDKQAAKSSNLSAPTDDPIARAFAEAFPRGAGK